LVLGARKDRIWLAVGGFLASVVGRLCAGFLGAAILAGIFCVLIRPWHEPATGAMQVPPSRSERGPALA
jgi:hypothetical protein